MEVIKHLTVMCDVDDTLVMHDVSKYPGQETVGIDDPITGKKIHLVINKPMVRLVKEEIRRGRQVFVWSRGGYEWATAVVTALGLDTYPIIVMDKPLVYFDDKDCQEWLNDRVYLLPTTPYKGET